MVLPTQRIRIFAACFAALFCVQAPAFAQSADVTRQSHMVTIQIGNEARSHTIPMAAYNSLVRQGVQIRVLSRIEQTPRFSSAPAIVSSQPAPTGDAPLTMTGWSVGVFR